MSTALLSTAPPSNNARTDSGTHTNGITNDASATTQQPPSSFGSMPMISNHSTTASSGNNNAMSMPYAPSLPSASSSSPPSPSSSASPLVPLPSAMRTKSRSRGKNKEKHNQSESRRRDRLRNKFLDLKQAAACDKKDRIAILAHATEKLKENENTIRQSETERGVLLEQLNHAHNAVAQAQAHSAAVGGNKAFLKLETHDSIGRLMSGSFQFLNYLPTAFIGLDGKFLDMNQAFLHLIGQPAEVMMNATIFTITPQHELTPTFFSLKRLLAGELDCWDTDRSCLTGDNNIIPVHLTMSVAKTGGKPEFFTCFFVPKDPQHAYQHSLSHAQQAHNLQQSLSMTQHSGLPINATPHSQQPPPMTTSSLMSMANGMNVVGLNNANVGLLPVTNPSQINNSGGVNGPQNNFHMNAPLNNLSAIAQQQQQQQQQQQGNQQRFDQQYQLPFQQQNHL